MNNYTIGNWGNIPIVRISFVDEQVVAFLNSFKKEHPNTQIILEIPNTKEVDVQALYKLNDQISIRIVGGYTKERVNRNWDNNYENGEKGSYYFTSVIYSRNESILLIKEMEELEKGIKPEWSDLQKVVYLYEKIKQKIMYDPKYESKSSADVRSLRGLLTKQTVCAGYSMIFKELLDRQGIPCSYVEGVVPHSGEHSAHAWNIVHLNGKNYGFDLTWDASSYRRGDVHYSRYLGADVEQFAAEHLPNPDEPLQNYRQTLSSLSTFSTDRFRNSVNIEQTFEPTTFYRTRADGSQYMVSQVGQTHDHNGQLYCKYIFSEIVNGKATDPLFLISDTNIAFFTNEQNFGRISAPEFDYALDNILFSPKNIQDSLNKGTHYIGTILKSNLSHAVKPFLNNLKLSDNQALPNFHGSTFPQTNLFTVVSDVEEIQKQPHQIEHFRGYSRIYTRSNGTKFLAFTESLQPFCMAGMDGFPLLAFDIYEILDERRHKVVKRNAIWTEKNILEDSRQEIADVFLSRSQLDNSSSHMGGYIGFLDENGLKVQNPRLVDYFDPTKRVENTVMYDYPPVGSVPLPVDEEQQVQLPTFDELHDLACNYEFVHEEQTQNSDKVNSVIGRNRNTHIAISDKTTADNAIFAHVWLDSAGLETSPEDLVSGEKFAFSTFCRNLYNYSCKKAANDYRQKGFLDTLELFSDASHFDFERAQEIIANLFENKHKTDWLDTFLRTRLGYSLEKTFSSEPLYNVEYAEKALQITNNNKTNCI